MKSSNNAPPEDRLITEKEVQTLLSLGESTVQQWRMYGKGPKFVKLGRAVRYRLSDVQEYLRTLRTPSRTSQTGDHEHE